MSLAKVPLIVLPTYNAPLIPTPPAKVAEPDVLLVDAVVEETINLVDELVLLLKVKLVLISTLPFTSTSLPISKVSPLGNYCI